MGAKKRILLIEDSPTDALLLYDMLEHSGEFTLDTANRVSEAVPKIAVENYVVILLDLSLPDAAGLETVKWVSSAAQRIPIIVLTGLEDDALAVDAIQLGAQDYLVKGQIDGSTLERAIRYAVERKRLQERLEYLATHDELTRLPNRALFNDRLNAAIERARRGRTDRPRKWELALMLLDLDNFKAVNDTLGHSYGDALLKSVAQRLKDLIRKSDSVARMGGDEFTLIFENLSGQDDVEHLARRILGAFSQPFSLNEGEWQITASIGISLYPLDGEDPESLIKHADIAMYLAKQEHNRYCFWPDAC